MNGNDSNGSTHGNGSDNCVAPSEIPPTNGAVATATANGKKKRKKKPPKEKPPRPKPGEIRLTKALDGSPRYGCPECSMVHTGAVYMFSLS